MKNLSLTYSPYTLQLKNPFHTSKAIIKTRRGYLIKLLEGNEFSGIGDVCPFPEFGSESLSEVEDALSDFKLELKIDVHNIEESIFECLGKFENLPALRHGIEQAILNLLCKKFRVSLQTLLKLKLRKNIFVNAVIGLMSPGEASKKVEKYVKNGFKTIKIKAGRENFKEDYSVIETVRNRIGSSFKIRIDSNGNWNLNEAIANLKLLDDLDIEFAEQPVNKPEEYLELKKHCIIPLAPDESVRSVKDAKKFIDNDSVSYIILKPMLIGGLLPTMEIISYAESHNITPVITTSFESAIGKANAIIAAASTTSNTAHGFGVNNFFINDLAEDPYQTKSGTITIH